MALIRKENYKGNILRILNFRGNKINLEIINIIIKIALYKGIYKFMLRNMLAIIRIGNF